MLLCCRNSSNTAQNILHNRKCALTFADNKPEDKIPKYEFKVEKRLIEENTGEVPPMVLIDAIEGIECSWGRKPDNAQNDLPGERNTYGPLYHDFNGITSKFGAYFILKVDWAKENNAELITAECI